MWTSGLGIPMRHGRIQLHSFTTLITQTTQTCIISIISPQMNDHGPTMLPNLPADLEAVFSQHEGNDEALLTAFMPIFCDHVKADRIFLQPRNPFTRVCKILQWRRNEEVPW
jgi:hypothetical protein